MKLHNHMRKFVQRFLLDWSGFWVQKQGEIYYYVILLLYDVSQTNYKEKFFFFRNQNRYGKWNYLRLFAQTWRIEIHNKSCVRMDMKISVKILFICNWETKWRLLDLLRGLLLSNNLVFLYHWPNPQEYLVQSVILFYVFFSLFPLETKQNSTWIWHTTAIRHPLQLK